MPRSPRAHLDPLSRWLSLDFSRPERSYYPDLRDFLSELLGYPRDKVVTEDRSGEGYPDLVLLNAQGDPWVVGDFKLEDRHIADPASNAALWREKRKYVTGTTRYVLFVTPRYLQLRDATGKEVALLHLPRETTDLLRQKLAPISWEKARHEEDWKALVEGRLPYAYLVLDPEGTRKLQEDLKVSFAELTEAASRALLALEERYQEYRGKREEAERNLAGALEETRRRILARIEGEYPEALKALFERHLPRFADQYGREIEGEEEPSNPRIREAFAADSAAALIARVLFLRFLEDLGLTKRRLTDGGPERWREFVQFLTDKATALVKVASLDLSQAYAEPFEEETFSWILETNGEMDLALQRLILRVNAYDFSGLSEEVLGDIYQNFLPPDKRKRLGEFYTPKEVVDLILRETALAHGESLYPEVLDPACGSGSFLVRYLHHRMEDAKARGVHLDSEALSRSIWGFDLNPFAAYVSMFQLLWGFLRLKKGKPEVHVYNLNSLLDDSDIAFLVKRSPGEEARDEKEWDYVVGNPPYIRAERAKYGQAIRDLYREVWGQNGDTGLLFLWRAMRGSGATAKPWVKKGGKLGMVVSGGYANSEAAAPVWSLLWPGKEWSLRKLVWMEFVEENGRQKNIWDAARIPLVLILERTPPKEEDEVEIWVPSSWPKEAPEPHEVSRVRYRDFFDPKVNPQGEARVNGYGEYLLPLLRGEDAPLLKKLYPGGAVAVSLTEAMETQYTRQKRPQPFWWTYGIQRGGVSVTESPQGARPVPVLAGRGMAVAWEGEKAGYTDLEAVRARPYGKLSLWGRENPPESYLVVANIALTPFGALVRQRNEGVVPAALDTLIVGVPKPDLAEAVAAYLNSSLVRWYWAVRLRSGVIQGYYAHIYPRTLEALPWPREPRRDLLDRLAELYRTLEGQARASRDNPREWLSREVERRIENGAVLPLSAPLFGLDFTGWQDRVPPKDLRVDGMVLRGSLHARLDLRDPDLARFVHLLLTSLAAEFVASEDLQKLFIPRDYQDLLREYHVREKAFSRAKGDFLNTLAAVDEAVFDLFGLTSEERKHIVERLGSFPLDRLRPRYPWDVEEIRPLRAYTEDRFK
ncbi:N-6 DNA methylase [Thermus scotoductus]|uniref:N-6 DNA methylase n=2 Tax=Thermus scotoductus TaxID=37636 RepID=A0A430S653_THESC|nr:N-6 DNA methylase [Thermus scotoductus]RTG93861.1 N-6 DNA methylase [Thermus scotoductus]RTH07030.1 N-6 DNA methylase [Thermus scotoductus]RTH08852.1 N-6 DNA methylase [Thermus scotoductus]RTH10035.1 N-6 DNA methylase [Thermus scotoductus]RTH24774.1 N-6 DNA methylase [Thermus scotoductus]